MINIKLDEKCIFTYDAENLSIGIWQHQDGWLEGPVQPIVGNIQFSNLHQFEMLHEMLELAIEKINKANKKCVCCGKEPAENTQGTGGGRIIRLCNSCLAETIKQNKYPPWVAVQKEKSRK